MARALRQSLLDQGVPQSVAETAVLEYVRKGTQELLKAYENRQKIAADLAQSQATTGKLTAETAQIAPNAEANRASVGASTAMTQAQTANIPQEMAIKERGAGTNERLAGVQEGELGLRSRELDSKIDQETREFAAQFDVDESGTINGDEYEKLFASNRRALQSKNESEALGMDEEKIYQEAKKKTDAEVSDYATLRTEKPWTKIKLRGGVQADGNTQQALAKVKEWKSGGRQILDKVKAMTYLQGMFPNLDADSVNAAL
jgi:hypothetical protein